MELQREPAAREARFRACRQLGLAAVVLVFAVGGGCVRRAPHFVSGPAPGPTAEQRARVERVETQQAAPEKVTADLIELLTEADWTVARLAKQALAQRVLTGRPLSAEHVARLERIVATFPFGDPSLGWPSADARPPYRSSAFAWRLLADEYARTRSVKEQVAWFIPQLQPDGPFAHSQADEAAQRLQTIGAPAVPALVKVVQTGNGQAPAWALRTLGRLHSPAGNRAVVAWAMPRLRDTAAHHWANAATILGELDEASAFEPMVAALWQHIDDCSRDSRGVMHSHVSAIIEALPKVGGQRAVTPLRKVITDYPPDARHPQRAEGYVSAAEELKLLGDPLGRRALEKAANSDLVEVRRRAVERACLALGRQAARPLLQRLAHDRDKRVRAVARRELQMPEECKPPQMAPPP